MEFGVIVQTDITAFMGEVGRIMKNRDDKRDNASFLHHARSMHKTTMGHGEVGTHWVHSREQSFKRVPPHPFIALQKCLILTGSPVPGGDAEAVDPFNKFAKGACPEKCVAGS